MVTWYVTVLVEVKIKRQKLAQPINIWIPINYCFTKDRHKNGTNCLPAWHAMR